MSPLAIRDSSGSVEFGLQRVRARPVNNRTPFRRISVERPLRDGRFGIAQRNYRRKTW